MTQDTKSSHVYCPCCEELHHANELDSQTGKCADCADVHDRCDELTNGFIREGEGGNE
jgi:hypothetical protein